LQAFINLGLFEKTYIQEHAKPHPQKSHFGSRTILFRTPRSLGTPCWEHLT